MSLFTDISSITTIPVLNLENLAEKEQLCILHKISENEKKGESITTAELGFGTLYISHIEEEVKFKFIPSRKFEIALRETLATGESPLINVVEDALKTKILNAYKDLF